MLDDKPFCCNGCKTVYQILNEKNLNQYYEFEKMPGIRVENPDLGDRYAFLDLDEIREKLLDFSDGGISKATFFVPGIHCASCIWLLENLNTLNPGIIQSAVNFPKKEVTVTFHDSEISLRQVVELMASIHYIPEITLDRLDKSKESKSNKTLLLKIGIAGFVLMNVMMYNFPEYLPGGELLESDFKSFFGWLSLILSIPVVVYCSNDYYLAAIKSLRKKIISIDLPIALGIFTLFLQSTWDIVSGAGIGYLDSLSGLVFFLLIGKWYQGKTYQALSFERDYKSYFPVAVTRISEGREEVIPLEKLQTGDHLLIRNQELIPADATLAKGTGNIDYSFVTGESYPVHKEAGEMLYAGGRQTGAAIEVEVARPVEQSYLTSLWNQSVTKESEQSTLNAIINKVSQWFTLTILTIALTAGIIWAQTDIHKALFVFTSVLIIACPCALALTVPFTFGSTMRQFGRRGFYLKQTGVIETLNKITAIVFDKTGTITQSKSVDIEWIGEDVNNEELAAVAAVARHSTHPMSVSLFAWLSAKLEKEGTFIPEVDDFREITGLGITGLIKGKRVNLGSSKMVTGKEPSDDELLQSRVFFSFDGKFKGYFSFRNQYRPGLQEALNDLKRHFRLHLLTGDHEAEKENLRKLFGPEAELRFRQKPEDKLNYVRKLRGKGETVLMIGDGLNDAGALLESDAGITIADDVYHFSPACDAILESSKFKFIHRFIRFTHTSMNVVKISFLISFIYNVGGLFFAVQGQLTPVLAAVLMPISSVTVVTFATLAIDRAAKRKIP